MVTALFLIEHAYSHFLHEGLIWRHVLDWMMFSGKHKDEIDWVELNEKMALLQTDLQEGRQPQITVTYFRPDEKKSGGAYIVREGAVKKVDPYSGTMLLTDETRIPLSGIFDMELKKG